MTIKRDKILKYRLHCDIERFECRHTFWIWLYQKWIFIQGENSNLIFYKWDILRFCGVKYKCQYINNCQDYRFISNFNINIPSVKRVTCHSTLNPLPLRAKELLRHSVYALAYWCYSRCCSYIQLFNITPSWRHPVSFLVC